MKNLKKTTAVLTATALMSMSMGMIAYAANPIITQNGSDSKAVNGTYKHGLSGETVYKVDIDWGGMEFTYNAGDAGSWNPDTHNYSENGEGYWSVSENSDSTITVTNHSNAAITATISFQPETTFSGVTAAYTNGAELKLDNAAVASLSKPGDAPTASTVVSLHGGNPSSFDGTQKIGTLTITIADTNTQ